MELKEIEELLKEYHWVEVRCGTMLYRNLIGEIDELAKDFETDEEVNTLEDFDSGLFHRVRIRTAWGSELEIQHFPEFNSRAYYKEVAKDGKHTLRSLYPQIILPFTGVIIDDFKTRKNETN